ncbi:MULTISPECIES: hypothetical protein [unclassified Neptuniibacter]|jgi:hypothetical protein|uniref:hypothetical protein n=1 Tax=unclassified Neptuniibacter TaxID=2630693 RepID=UPI0026E2099E|nr:MULTISPECIES: hypothetical protein [unclassified Neptuniibacter]MDO6512940.1 hypothetical protein [Neptuniibacter sp. 2_MG-2023]MDO6592865.1 hypothetical protein [Neptuniibacter sp. 1_MG-2023]
MNSICRMVCVVLLSGSTYTQAALAPSAANLKDLNTMVQFISQHPLVAQRLKQIDLRSLTIFFDHDCEAYFERQQSSFLTENMPGPQPGIKFKSSNCSLVENNGE